MPTSILGLAHALPPAQRVGSVTRPTVTEAMRAIAVQMDVFVSERALHASGVVGRALEAMAARGFIYEKDGARWFKSEPFGDEKDRVVQRSDGELTYFAADIGYHGEKVSRGYDELIDVWGADHHGYVKRVAAAIEALGADPKKFQVLLVQLVRLTRGGEPVRMGVRHKSLQLEGVQFHPESILTLEGKKLLHNFLEQTK